MIIKLIHLNIERSKHIDKVFALLKNERPNIVCFQEAIYEDMRSMAKKLGYELAFAPLLTLKEGKKKKQEGSIILSKYPMKNIRKCRYDDKILQKVPVCTEEDILSKDGVRPEGRFSYFNTLLIAEIQITKTKTITVATTHFPVADRSTPGLPDHELKTIKNVMEIGHTRTYLDRLIKLIRELPKPIIFTSDLNNNRGEYFYDSIAHELIDIVPSSVNSTIDPSLHRKPKLELMVDTIMVSPGITVEDFKVIEGISDHKVFFASLRV